jgi:hypothetical protein
MTSYDHYKVAENIARNLLRNGYDQWSRCIKEAIETGSTSTEILMALRWNLEKLLTREPELPQKIKNDVEKLLSKTNESLK